MTFNQSQIPREFKSINQVVPGLLKRLEKRKNSEKGMLGPSTGFADIDCLTDGLESGDFWLMTARPGMGKTALCLQICSHGFQISTALKEIAIENQIAVVVASNLSRALESRRDKRPTLRDVRTCGRLDYAADIVCGIYRESYYDPEAPQHTAELIFLKNWQAGYATVELDYDGSCARFSDKGMKPITE